MGRAQGASASELLNLKITQIQFLNNKNRIAYFPSSLGLDMASRLFFKVLKKSAHSYALELRTTNFGNVYFSNVFISKKKQKTNLLI